MQSEQQNKDTGERKNTSSAARIIKRVLNILFYILVIGIIVFAISAKGNSGLSIAGYRSLIVLTSSMEPEIQAGSLAIIGPAGQLESGDIITFKVGNSNLTHRIVSVTQQGEYITKGDANQENDAGVVNASNIVGVYKFSIPYLGLILSFLMTPQGLILLLISLALLYLCFKWFRYFILGREKPLR